MDPASNILAHPIGGDAAIGRNAVPMVSPKPWWQLGMTATCETASGWEAVFLILSIAPGSISRRGGQELTGPANPSP